MNASSREAQRILRQRRATGRAQSKIARNGEATLKTHGIAAGLTPREARSVAASLRLAAHNLGIEGHEFEARIKWRSNSRRTGHVTASRYTPAQVAQMALAYQPRKDAYKTARQYLLAA